MTDRPTDPAFVQRAGNGDFGGSGGNSTLRLVIPPDGAALVISPSGTAETYNVELVNGGSGTVASGGVVANQVIVRAGRWYRFPGSTYRALTISVADAAAIWILTPPGPEESGVFRLNPNADTVAVVGSPIAGNSTIFPLAVSEPISAVPDPNEVDLSAIAATDFVVPAGEIWECETFSHPASAALAGTLIVHRGAGTTRTILSFALQVTQELLSLNQVRLQATDHVRVNITAGGAANTFGRLTKKRIQ